MSDRLEDNRRLLIPSPFVLDTTGRFLPRPQYDKPGFVADKVSADIFVTLSLPETSGILRVSLSVTDDPVLTMEDAVDGLGRHSRNGITHEDRMKTRHD